MSRNKKQPPSHEVRADERHAYERVIARQRGYRYGTDAAYNGRADDEIAGAYFGALLQSPLIADHISELGVVYRTRGEFPGSYAHQDREWIDMVLGHELGVYMWGHVLDGIAVGVDPDDVIALHEGRYDDISPDRRELAAYIRAFEHLEVTDEQYESLERRFGERGAVEYTAFVAHLCLTLRLLKVYSEHGEGGRLTAEEIVREVKRVKAGEIALPDPRARVPQLTISV
ncbi:hypothetical protein BH09ACT6_BH09ACT6_05580 [soil metagenome]